MRSLPTSQLLIAGFSLIILISSIYQYGGVSSYGAGFMPTILSGSLLFFSIVDCIIQFKKKKRFQITITKPEFYSLATITASVLCFIFLVEYLGFIICSTLLLFGLMAIRRPKKHLYSLGYSLIAAFVIHYVFGNILMVDLPEGIWG
ncbi:MAG TPA: tripartite tricarboxylate transporter TctB family protein [Psychromonas sp.]